VGNKERHNIYTACTFFTRIRVQFSLLYPTRPASSHDCGVLINQSISQLFNLASQPAGQSVVSIIFTGRQHSLLCICPVLATAKASVRLAVCPSHPAILSTRRKLGSRSLHCPLYFQDP